jgi:hypothetical protein
MTVRTGLPFVLALAACARPHDVTAVYARGPSSTGAVEVVLNNASDALSVSINDALVVDRKHSRRVRVEGIPPGPARITVATGGGCEAGRAIDREVEVLAGQTTTVPLPGPEPNTGCMVFAGLYHVGLQVGMVAVAVAVAAAVKAPRLIRGK